MIHKNESTGHVTDVVSHSHPIQCLEDEACTYVLLDYKNLNPAAVATRDYEIYLRENAINQP